MAIKPIANAERMSDEEKDVLYTLVTKWHTLSEQLSKLGAEEKELRGIIAAAYFPNAREGVNKITLMAGKELQLDYKINRKIDEAELDAAITTGVIPQELVAEIIKYKPNLSTTAWKAAPEEIKLKFASIVTESPGTPGMKIHSPKS